MTRATPTGRTPDLVATETHEPVSSAPDGALARCVGDVERFAAECWGQHAHLYRAADVAGLLTLDDVDHLVSSTALRTPAFRVVKAGATLPQGSYTRTARVGSRTITDLVDVGRVYDHFADGATIVLQGLHRYWPPVTELCRQLEDELTHPVQANAYITPPVAQGLRVHADAHDVFALQTHGFKQWVLYEGGDKAPPSLDTRLEPGDCLYLPTGLRHAARTVDSTSIHLTLGVRTVTWADVVRRVLDDAAADPSLAEPLPPAFAHDPRALEAEGRRRLGAVADQLRTADAGEAVERTARALRRRRVPSLAGQLRQIERLGDLSDTTTVRMRPNAVCDLEVADGRITVVLGDRTLRMPGHVEPALRRILELRAFTVADLSGELDGNGRVTLVRRLVREGLLFVDG